MSITALAALAPAAADTALSIADGTLKAAARIDSVAKDFESVFLSQLMKQMRQSLDSGGMFGTGTGDVHGGLFDFFMGKHLADAGGIGVAGYVQNQLIAKPTP